MMVMITAITPSEKAPTRSAVAFRSRTAVLHRLAQARTASRMMAVTTLGAVTIGV
jgi:hypothetical protein